MNYEKVLKKIRPDVEEIKRVQRVSKRIINEINKKGYEATLVGSSARRTFIKNSNDLDIFVFFPKNVKRERLEDQGLKLGKEILKKHNPKIHYAEHPYVKGEVEGIEVEIVPCYKIKKGERIISAVDRSPLHNEYMSKAVKGMEDQVLLFKKFLKANGCYGAEQKTNGFSGLLSEFLIVNYKTFEKVLQEASEWGPKNIINGKEKYKYKFKEQLVVIDPVDEGRNMAAAVSRETLTKFILLARRFLDNPSEKFFFPKDEKINLAKELKRNIVMANFGYPGEIIEEIVWGQLSRLEGILKQSLNDEGFQVLKSYHWTDEKRECAIIFELDSLILNKYKKHKGPEIFEREHVDKFIEKNGKVWPERNRLYTWQKRKYVRAVDYIKQLLIEMPLPSHLKKVGPRAKILQGRDLKRHSSIVKEFYKELI